MVLIRETNAGERPAAAMGFAELCAWASRAMSQPLPAPVRRRAALVLVDDIGAAVAASREPEVAAAAKIEIAASRGAEATILAPGGARIDRIGASVANGMAATWAELDEGYRLAPCHAGAYIWPALVAEAEAIGATVAGTLSALAVGYEITARMSRAFPFSAMTVHPHAAFATIGAASGVGLLRRLTAPQLLAAISGAASMSFAGPYGHAIDGALVRNAWTAAGALIGFRAVDWAAAGVGGIAETPYDVFTTCFGTAAEPEMLTRGLGDEWSIADGYHKVFACCQYAHSMIESSLELHRRLGPGAGDRINAIEVETHPRGMTLTAVEPPTVLSAKFSMPHAAAAVARRGTGGQEAFSADTLDDPSIAALRRNVKLKLLERIDPWPHDRAARVTWIMTDGSRHTAACSNARGGADQPFDEATLLDKLRVNTASVFPGMAARLAAALQSDGDDLPWREIVIDATGATK